MPLSGLCYICPAEAAKFQPSAGAVGFAFLWGRGCDLGPYPCRALGLGLGFNQLGILFFALKKFSLGFNVGYSASATSSLSL